MSFTLQFLVSVDVERTSGKFVGKGELAEAIESEIQTALDGAELDPTGAGIYAIEGVTCEVLSPTPGGKAKAK